MATKESDLQKLILDWLNINRYCAWRNYVGAVIRKNGIFSPNPAKGIPDILGILKNGSGRMFAIEVKSAKGRISPAQSDWIIRMNQYGAGAFVARDLETVIRKLRDMEEIYGHLSN